MSTQICEDLDSVQSVGHKGRQRWLTTAGDTLQKKVKMMLQEGIFEIGYPQNGGDPGMLYRFWLGVTGRRKVGTVERLSECDVA